MGQGFAEEADDALGWECREVGVCDTGGMGLVRGQQAGCGWHQGAAMGAAVPCQKHGQGGQEQEQGLPGAALGKLLEGGRLLLQMQRSCQGTEHSSQLWQRLCRCSGQVTF